MALRGLIYQAIHVLIFCLTHKRFIKWMILGSHLKGGAVNFCDRNSDWVILMDLCNFYQSLQKCNRDSLNSIQYVTILLWEQRTKSLQRF